MIRKEFLFLTIELIRLLLKNAAVLHTGKEQPVNENPKVDL